ncbi:MAG TPA: hypothetical protein VGO90_06570, partial [Chthoniobacteraceae bacterium]|nr:hypothetical protein [Chthoniobacteraceae bacterium]
MGWEAGRMRGGLRKAIPAPDAVERSAAWEADDLGKFASCIKAVITSFNDEELPRELPRRL